MIRTIVLDSKESKDKYFAAADRRRRNLVNSQLYTDAQKRKLSAMRQALSLVISGQVYEPSYGTTGVSIKVAKGFVIADRKSLRTLESEWAKEGIYRKETAQGILYRMDI